MWYIDRSVGDHYPGYEAHYVGLSPVFSFVILCFEQRWFESVRHYWCGSSCNNRDLGEEKSESTFFHISAFYITDFCCGTCSLTFLFITPLKLRFQGCHTILNLQKLESESPGADRNSSEQKRDIELTTIVDVNITTWDAPWDARTFWITKDETT
ncbi:hypothetical protein BDP27DRAFT_824395 [Rhodocollybia butyracea]|uniref:Uncharacterized protein n=1 Tax=Rhodocollybia butyracea TaxID=206335 RepID=A0A9P5U743_9AGAR|nr:hypothetical protein BDP27DRAFT_824395 [Rhodocollybia butyracea]